MAEGITRRGDSWRARYRHPETGRQHEQSFARQVDAVRWRRQQLDAFDRGRWVDPQAGKVSFLRYFEAWEQNQVWTDGTRKAMALAARSATFGDIDLRQIKVSHVEAWVKSMTVADERPATTAGARHHQDPVRQRPHGLPGRGPRRDDRRRPDRTASGSPASASARRRWRSRRPTSYAASSRPPTRRFRAFVALCAFAGLRLGEAAALKFGDVDFLRRQLHVRRQVQRLGGARSRSGCRSTAPSAPSPSRTRCWRCSPSTSRLGLANDWLFSGVEDVPPHQNTVGHRWRTTLKRAGVEGVRLHDLRHFYASGLIASGCDVVAVQRALGHAKSTTTLTTYAHLWPSARGPRPARPQRHWLQKSTSSTAGTVRADRAINGL